MSSERIAYEELQPGDVIQSGDEWQNQDGRWHPLVLMAGACTQVRDGLRARRPHNITQMENDRAEAIAEVAKLSTELWARKPLEERVASLTDELTQAREGSQQLLKTIAENADMFGDHTKALVQERDELQAALIESRLAQQRKVADIMEVCNERDEVEAELKRLQEVVGNLYSEPTARQVQDMLRTWATELDWSGCCFDSTGRDKVSAVQRVLIAVIERIESIINPEGGTDGE